MAMFGLFKSKQERSVEDVFRKINDAMFPRGELDVVRDCERVNALTHQIIPQAELRDFVVGCKALMYVSEDYDEARFVDSFVLRAINRITKSDAYDMYVYFEGEAGFYDKSSRHMKAVGKDISALSEELAGKMPWIYAQGTREETIQGAYGEYGLAVTNPIPTISVRSSNQYLSRLRFGGQPVTANRRGSTGTEVTPGSVDIYALTCNGREVGTVFICPYHKRNSKKPPKGFTLV